MLVLSGSQTACIYIYGLLVIAAASFIGWLHFFGVSLTSLNLGACAVLALMCALSRRFPLEFGRIKAEISDVAMLAALVLLGPVWAIAAAIPVMLYRERLRTVFVAATDSLKLLAAGYVLQLFVEPSLANLQPDEALVYGVVTAGAVFYLLDALINSFLLLLKYGTSPLQTLQESFLPLIPSGVAAILAALGTSYAVAEFGPAAALVLFCGAAGALISLHLIHGRQKENEALKAENASLLSSSVTFAGNLIESLGLKDGYTARHAASCAVYASDVATELRLETERVEKLKVAALLQDIGLISVPDEIILTPERKLNSVGRMHLERHPLQGESILASVPGFEEAARWVRWHHERIDGSGYPDRLRGEWLPLEAKILAVTGFYAASILDSPDNPRLTPQEARRKLVALAGQSLDQEVVRTFLLILDTRDENYAAASDHRFALSATPARESGASSITPTGTTEIQ